ncbi:MAG: efflux RND transporter periplasmic adaptor subunit [Verrucomicrobia subdivision 3 bacterium]|nr:efflux RND transporter periplasmic adaptor subunit [Limisphaerales bacterium]
MRKYWKWLIVLVVAGTVLLRFNLASTRVAVSVVQKTNIVAEVMGTGTLEARVKTILSPRIQERLAEVLVDQGDYVTAGQLLARLDDGELKRQVEVTEAALASAKATADRVRVDEARARAVEQQAQQDHKRVSDLVTTKVSSQSEMDKAIEQLHVAESDLLRARAATVEAQQQVNLAEKSLAYQQERLTFTRILSPYAGLVTRRDRDPGGVVVPGSSILQLINTNELWVSAWVDETASAALAVGQKARVRFRSGAGQGYPGEVARLGCETDRETREFLVDVRVQELPPNWTIGQRAEVFIETKRKADALAVPQRFIQWRDGTPGVFVAEGGKAAWRDVTLGLRGRETVEVTQGLSAGEKVVAPADPKQSPLKSGQRISPN